MSGSGGTWRALVREIGEALLDLLRAEADALARDLGASGRALARALVLAVVAGAVAFWALGLVIYLAVELLALVVPRWGAVGIVLGLFVLAAAALLASARARLCAIEPPDATVRRRLAESRRWWQERVAADAEPEPDLELEPESQDAFEEDRP